MDETGWRAGRGFCCGPTAVGPPTGVCERSMGTIGWPVRRTPNRLAGVGGCADLPVLCGHRAERARTAGCGWPGFSRVLQLTASQVIEVTGNGSL